MNKTKEEHMNKKLEWLESIRGIACLIVILAHIVSTDSEVGRYASGCGKIGVWAFMLISGMLTVLPYTRMENNDFNVKKILNYYTKRLLRIYPGYIVAILSIWVLGFIGPERIPHFLGVTETWGHLWFIPVIVKFYVIAPVFCILLSMLKNKFGKTGFAIFSLISIFLYIVFSIIFPYSAYIENSIQLRWYIPVFIMGMLIAVFIENNPQQSSAFFDVAILSVISVMLLVTPFFREMLLHQAPDGYLQNKYLYIGLCWGIILFAVPRSHYCLKYLNSCSWLQKVGTYSYGLYLFHYITLIKLTQYPMGTAKRGVITIIISGGQFS